MKWSVDHMLNDEPSGSAGGSSFNNSFRSVSITLPPVTDRHDFGDAVFLPDGKNIRSNNETSRTAYSAHLGALRMLRQKGSRVTYALREFFGGRWTFLS